MTAAWQRTRPCRGAAQPHGHLLAHRELQNHSLSALSGRRSSWAPQSSSTCFMRRSPGRRRLRPCANAGAAEIAAFALGYGCMVGSCFRSLPQILKIVRSGSAVGLSLTSHVVELLTDVVKLAYNTSKGYHIAAFGENATCAIQGVILVALIGWHSQLAKEHAAVLGLALGLFGMWLFSPICTPGIMSALQVSTIAVGILGRVPQIILNFSRGDAGVLSASSCAMNLAGNLARVFTSVVLTGDALVLAGAVMMALLNGTLLQQALATKAQRYQRHGTQLA